MSVEVEKINLCSLKMDETFNLWGRNVCIILARSCNIDEIVGSHECQVISLYFTVCVCVCARACSRLHLYLSVWAHEPQSCCMASSISCPLLTSIHISSPAHLPPPGPPPSLLVRCPWRWFTSETSGWAGSGRRPGEKRTSRECCVSQSRDGGVLRSAPAGGVRGSMVRGLFAAGFKKRREYVKHLIDPRAPSRPEATDKGYTIKELVHINSGISHGWMEAVRVGWRKEPERETLRE